MVQQDHLASNFQVHIKLHRLEHGINIRLEPFTRANLLVTAVVIFYY